MKHEPNAKGGASPDVVLIHPSDELYGADRVLLNSVKALQRVGWTAEVWLPLDVDYPAHRLCSALNTLGVVTKHIDLPILRRSYLKPRDAVALYRRVRHFRAIAAHGSPRLYYFNTSATLLCCWALRGTAGAELLHVHEILSKVERLLLYPLLRLPERVVAVSRATRDSLPGRLRDATEVIYNGFDYELTHPASRCKDTNLTFLVASRWNTWKGHRLLLSAWAQLERKDCRLEILGGPPPSGVGVNVEDLAELLSNSNSVTIVGEVADVRAFIERADVVVVPSQRPDPLPTIAIEASLCGKAVLCSDSGGLPEIVSPDTGWLIPPGDLTEWVRVLSSISQEDAVKKGRAARITASRRFNIGEFETKICRVVSELLRSGTS